MSNERHPEVIWAQRSDKIFITIEVPDARDVKVGYTPEGKLTYSGFVGSEPLHYTLDFELFDKLKVDDCKTKEGPRHTLVLLAKEERKWWPRLVKASGKAPPNLKVDWDKWVDEDEESSAGKFDPDFMKQFEPPGGFGAEDDDDDDDLPELEK